MSNLAKVISHQSDAHFCVEDIQNKLKNATSLTLPLEEELCLLNELTEFPLGKWLLENKGLNGFWTAYIILQGIKQHNLSPLEHWVLHKCPIVLATRERFHIFKDQLQHIAKPGMHIASIPCGLMDDLLSLDIENITLYGLDLDQKSLKAAAQNTALKKKRAVFSKTDAWNLSFYKSQFDVITSNGLNIYEPGDNKVIDLYRQFNQALKPKGILITSFLTPPNCWKNYETADIIKQKALFKDIIGVKWQCMRTEQETRIHLEKANFKILSVIYDQQAMFPTIIAKKR